MTNEFIIADIIKREKELELFQTKKAAMKRLGAEVYGGPYSSCGKSEDYKTIVFVMWPDQITIKDGKYYYNTKWLTDDEELASACWRKRPWTKNRNELLQYALQNKQLVRIISQRQTLVQRRKKEGTIGYYAFPNELFKVCYHCADGEYKGDYGLMQVLD